MIKEIRRVTTIKRATKFMKRDGLDEMKIMDIMAKSREMENDGSSSSESDDDVSDNRKSSPR